MFNSTSGKLNLTRFCVVLANNESRDLTIAADITHPSHWKLKDVCKHIALWDTVFHAFSFMLHIKVKVVLGHPGVQCTQKIHILCTVHIAYSRFLSFATGQSKKSLILIDICINYCIRCGAVKCRPCPSVQTHMI